MPESFLERVGRLPCVDCMADSDADLDGPLCDYDLHAWFDSIMEDERFDLIIFCDVC